MLLERHTAVHWDYWVYIEMFVAGIAAGAYVTAAVLEVLGRGRSPLARTAHLIAFPLMAAAGLLLIVDLNRPERFWHMVLQSTRPPLPMFKWWSPMSFGAWGVLLFSGFAFVSFLDALVDAGRLRLGGWRQGRTLHGGPLGVVWSVLGGIAAFFIGAYSGVLLNVTNLPAWGHSVAIGPLFVATAGATGLAAILLIQALRVRRADTPLVELDGLARATLWVVVWQMLMVAAFLVTLGQGAPFILTGIPLLAVILAVVLGGIGPLAIWLMRGRARTPRLAVAPLAVPAALVLIGSFFLRYAIVMGPQRG